MPANSTKNTKAKKPAKPRADQVFQSKNSMRRDIAITVAAALLVVLGVVVYLNRVIIYDWFLAISYHAPAEVTAIEDEISLTDRAKLIFAASRPSLDNRDDFNRNCDSHETEISILGCYSDGHIYIYNINNNDLNGIKESTAAHELLHAVWERMNDSDRSRIGSELMNVYNDSKHHDLLASDLDTYSSADRMDELHSRIGTEIKDLPDELEKHYARYFKNQDLVVSFYDSYITPFRELDEEIRALEEELEKVDKEIDQKTSEYYKQAESLAKEIDEFNRCTATEGCFASNAAFLTRRNELLNAQAGLENLYNQTNEIVNHYNSLVVEYNSHILRGKELEKAMNSNIEEKEVD